MNQEVRQLIKPLSKWLLLVILVGSIASLSTVGLMGLAAWLVASAALQPPLYTLSLAITGVRFCGIFRAVFRYLERLLSHKVGFAVFNNLRTYILAEIIAVLPFAKPKAAGNMYEVIVNAIDDLRDSFLRFFLPPLTSTVATFIVIIWLAFFDWRLALLFLVFWLGFVMIFPWWAYKIYAQIPRDDKGLTQEIIEFYEGSAELEIYGFDRVKLDDAKAQIEAYQQYRTTENKVKAQISLVAEIAMGACWTLLVATICHLNFHEHFDAIMGITIILLGQALLEFLMMVPGLVEHVYEARHSWGKLQDIITSGQANKEAKDIEATAVKAEPPATLAGLLSTEAVAYGYTEPVMENLSLYLAPGKKTLLLGPSGCGKSTLFYVLTKLLKPQQGNLWLEGKNYEQWSDEALREEIAPSFQDHHIFQGTVRYNFQMLYPTITDEEIITNLAKVGLMHLASKEGLDVELINDGSNLSGGQRHRFQLAICLAKNKKLILLDEPTSGLDIISSRKILGEIMGSYAETTMLVTSHDLSILPYFDKIIILSNQGVVEQGDINELLLKKDSKLAQMVKYHNIM